MCFRQAVDVVSLISDSAYWVGLMGSLSFDSTQDKWIERRPRGFVDTTFRGSSASLVMRALGNGSASPEDLAKIKAMIEDMENQQ